MEVYCKNCKYIKRTFSYNASSGYQENFLCKFNPHVYDTPINIVKEYKNAFKKNAFNDCADYTPKFFHRLKRLFKK